jgi:cytoskeleton protein RodZ
MLIARSTTPLLSVVSTRSDGMSQLGTRLHYARTSQGISLTEAAVATRISVCYLLALEAGAYQTLPSQTCARGFIRNYANYLGVPAVEMIELYHCEYGMPEPIRIVPAITPLSKHGQWLANFLGVSFVVLLLAAMSYLVLGALS